MASLSLVSGPVQPDLSCKLRWHVGVWRERTGPTAWPCGSRSWLQPRQSAALPAPTTRDLLKSHLNTVM